MKFSIIAVGHKMPEWIVAGVNEYLRRMPRSHRIELKEIKPAERTSGKTVHQWLAIEAERILDALPARCFKIVLDERGKKCSTAELARHIENWQRSEPDVAFIIGGADGTAPELRAKADWLMTLSALTLPHGLCRVILAEQLYRAVSLLAGHPYHRE